VRALSSILWNSLTRRGLASASAVLLAVLAVQALTKRGSEWQDVYVRAGLQWWSRQDIYGAGSAYLYPPFQAMMAAPFGAVPEWLSRLCWFAMSALSMIVMVTLAWLLAQGPPLKTASSMQRREWFAFALGLICSFSYILNAFAHQQTDVMIGALLIGGVWYFAAGRDVAGGALIGVAAACKATPLLWCPYLLWHKRWTAAFVVGTVALVVNFAPDFVPPPDGGFRIVQWFSRYVQPTQQIDATLGTWGSAIEYNQSLSGTVQRLINTRLDLTGPEPQIAARPVVPSQTLKLIVYAMFLSLIAISIFAAMRARRIVQDAGELPRPVVIEYSIVFTLMLLMSPMSSRAHFGILILPAFCLARVAVATRDLMIWTIIGSVAVLTMFINKDLVGSFAHDVFLWLGATTFSTGLLWFGCIYVLWRNPRLQDVVVQE